MAALGTTLDYIISATNSTTNPNLERDIWWGGLGATSTIEWVRGRRAELPYPDDNTYTLLLLTSSLLPVVGAVPAPTYQCFKHP